MAPEEVWRTQQVKHSDYNNQDEGMSLIKSVYNYNFFFYSFRVFLIVIVEFTSTDINFRQC